MALSFLAREQEYYRPGVWKIYYRVDSRPVREEYKSPIWEGIIKVGEEVKIRDIHPDEIKFSGHDAEARSLAIFEVMKLECTSNAELHVG